MKNKYESIFSVVNFIQFDEVAKIKNVSTTKVASVYGYVQLDNVYD